MTQVEKLKIFLASPGDVNTERQHVEKVVEEINRTVATALGVMLQVISSKNAFPGYGKDGQAILNEQIGKMQDYELFIGIMWNRIGTPTPRAKSGTVEEFARAVKALMRKHKPKVWFYFRQSPTHLTTKEQLKQREEVLDFRAKFQSNGYFRDYKAPAEFRDQLREHLTLWLNQRKGEAPKYRAAGTKQSKAISKAKVESESSASDRQKTTSTDTTRAAIAKTTTATKPSATSRKTLATKSSTTHSTGALKSPENWVLLDGNFFQTKSCNTLSDRSIILQISPKDMEQTAQLKALHPGEFHNRKQIAFANSYETEIMQVSSVTSESVAGKISFSITLNPNQRSHNRGFTMEPSFNNHSADEIAQLRTRLILLGEALPKDLERSFTTQFNGFYNHPVTIDKGIFPDLWAKLQTQPRLFLPKAWLWAIYHLKVSQLVEDVLELELGPIKNKVMPVRFRGRRRCFSPHQELSIIEVVGNCTLST